MRRSYSVSTGRIGRRSFRWALLFAIPIAAIIIVMLYRGTQATVCTSNTPRSPSSASFVGSRAVVNRVYAKAENLQLEFMASRSDVLGSYATGTLVRVRSDNDLTLSNVSYPYALPATALFLSRLSAQYRAACGEILVVTSLMRTTEQNSLLRNASTRSVHPTGMAVDLRVPVNTDCRRWLERVLISLELRGYLEVTREKYPLHYHIAVYPCEYSAYVRRQGG